VGKKIIPYVSQINYFLLLDLKFIRIHRWLKKEEVPSFYHSNFIMISVLRVHSIFLELNERLMFTISLLKFT
jgi:hypothetical protein